MYQFQRRWWPLCTPCSPQLSMFNLMSNCCTWMSKIQEPIRKVTILVVGLDKSGKTSSIRGMLRVPHYIDTGPTTGCIRHELRVENYLVTLIDTGGSVESRASWREHYGEAHGIIFVVDSSDRLRMREVRDVLAELLKQARVAGKPILVLANKQDKMNSLVGSELIEILSLERLVNQSRSLCHIEPCSALMDLRRWSDRKILRGLRWLLRAVSLDFPELCARVAQDSKRPLEPKEKERNDKGEKGRKKTKVERMKSSKSDLRQVHRPREKEKKSKSEGKLQPIRNILQKEATLKKKLRTKQKKKKLVNVQEDEKDCDEAPEQEDEGDGTGEQENSCHRDKANTALIPPKKNKLKPKRKVKEGELGVTESLDNDKTSLKANNEGRKKKKVMKVKRKNKINTEETPEVYLQPVDLSSTFDLYRKAILALKERQDQGQ